MVPLRNRYCPPLRSPCETADKSSPSMPCTAARPAAASNAKCNLVFLDNFNFPHAHECSFELNVPPSANGVKTSKPQKPYVSKT